MIVVVGPNGDLFVMWSSDNTSELVYAQIIDEDESIDGGYYDQQNYLRDGRDGGTPMSLEDLLGDEVAELIRVNKLPPKSA